MDARTGFGVLIWVAMPFVVSASLSAPRNRLRRRMTETARPERRKTRAVDNSPEAIMNRRFPQKVRVGDLVGLPMLDDNDGTLGRVQRVVRSPEGNIKLIVNYSKWFGWFGRPVAVPIEVVAILARQIASLDMLPAAYEAAPTWTEGRDIPIPDGDIIRIAVTRR